MAGLESCDDLNVESGDGCSNECQEECGYVCDAEGGCSTSCGDGIKAGDENCDDKNIIDGDGCSSVCSIEAFWACLTEECGLSACRIPSCGDGVLEGNEFERENYCDDGNLVPGDGCSSTCQVECGYVCSGGSATNAATCDSICGDGLRKGFEDCDDGNTDDGDGCSNICTVEENYACFSTGFGDLSGCTAGAAVCISGICGVGNREESSQKQCDDGNSLSGDGCSASCEIECGYECAGGSLEGPDQCKATTCGDAKVILKR